MARKFVIVVDAQRDFMLPDGALYVAGAEALVRPLNAWLAALDPADVEGVLMTFDTHFAETYPGTAEAAQFPIHCVRGSAGWELAIDPDAIDPTIPVHTLEKGVFAMWEEPDVTIRAMRSPEARPIPRDRFFDDLRRRGVEDVLVAGVAADFCVRWAVEGLIARGFRVVVPRRLTRGIVRQIGAVVADEWTGRDVALT